jgi:hypothetical protein
MERIRTIGAALAILAAVVAVMLMQVDASDRARQAAAILIAAAACLAVVVPFRAPDPRARWRVVIATFVYTAGTVAASVWAAAQGATLATLAAIAPLAVAGALLTVWAFRTRNRRQRRTGMQVYYKGEM